MSSHRPSTFYLEIAERGGFICYGLENRLVFPTKASKVRWVEQVSVLIVNLTCDHAGGPSPPKKKLDRMK